MIDLADSFNKLSSLPVSDASNHSFATILFRSPPAIEDMKARIRSYQDSYLYLNSELVEGAVPTTSGRLTHVQSVFADWCYTHREVLAAVVSQLGGLEAEVSGPVSVKFSDSQQYSSIEPGITSIKALSSIEDLGEVTSVDVYLAVGHNVNPYAAMQQRIGARVAGGKVQVFVATFASVNGVFADALYDSFYSSIPKITVEAINTGVYTNRGATNVSITGNISNPSITSLSAVKSSFDSFDPDLQETVQFTGKATYFLDAVRVHIHALAYCLEVISAVGLTLPAGIDVQAMLDY